MLPAATAALAATFCGACPNRPVIGLQHTTQAAELLDSHTDVVHGVLKWCRIIVVTF
jgi:hypothetical protein